MKKLNFKQEKYVFPVIALPFLLFGFYIYKDSFEKTEDGAVVVEDGIQTGIAASSDVRNRDLGDKMDAFQNRYRDADGYTAITALEAEAEEIAQFDDLYSEAEKRRLDSIDRVLEKQIADSQKNIGKRSGYVPSAAPGNSPDQELLRLLTASQDAAAVSREEEKTVDPIHMMREQYRLMDSFQKASDPEHQAELLRQQQQELAKKEAERLRLRKLTVQRANMPDNGFNTVSREREKGFIRAIIDEDITGYAGSRIRIRLTEDIKIGNNIVKKGTYLYAMINGFSEQRVTMKIVSVMYRDKILPVDLSIYDLDGMEGLYVPASAFREFTKELGSSSMQGFNMNSNAANQQEFLMSTLERTVQSTSSAIAKAIRKNKAKFKYNTFVYLIDPQELKEN